MATELISYNILIIYSKGWITLHFNSAFIVVSTDPKSRNVIEQLKQKSPLVACLIRWKKEDIVGKIISYIFKSIGFFLSMTHM